MGFLSSDVVVKPKCELLVNFKAALVLACCLIVQSVSCGGTPTTSSKLPLVMGLQHRDFDEQLAPNLSPQETLQSAVRRSHARKARIEGMLSKVAATDLSHSTTLERSDRFMAKTGEVFGQGKDVKSSPYDGKPEVDQLFDDRAAKLAGSGAKLVESMTEKGGQSSNAWKSTRTGEGRDGVKYRSGEAETVQPDSLTRDNKSRAGVSKFGGRVELTKVGGSGAKLEGTTAETGEDRSSSNGTEEGRDGATFRRGEGYSAEMEAGDGAYLTSIYIGSPATRVRAIMDTGSDLVWQQCRPCVACFAQPDMPIFDPALSSSFKRVGCDHKLCQQLLFYPSSPASNSSCVQFSNSSCQYTYVYGDSSYTSGELALDTLTLLDPHGQTCLQIRDFAFGCGYTNRGISFSDADGVLGMGQGPLSLASQLSIPYFSYCLTSHQVSQLSPLLLGDHASNFRHTNTSSQVQVTPILRSNFIPTFYYLNLTGISVDGLRLDLPSETFALKENGTGGLIIDSGTTITYLQEQSYRIVLQAIQSRISNQLQIPRPMFGLDLCFLSFDASMLPTLTFHFDGADMMIPSSSLFAHVGELYCLALGGSNDVSILGNIHQQNYQMLYDRGERKLSFVAASCDQILT